MTYFNLEIYKSNIEGGEAILDIQDQENEYVIYDESNFDKKEYFVDATNGDFHLASISPSLAMGRASAEAFTNIYNITSKYFDGKPRVFPYGTMVDLGAYENKSSVRGNIKYIACFGVDNVTITLEPMLGTAPYTYLWDDKMPLQWQV